MQDSWNLIRELWAGALMYGEMDGIYERAEENRIVKII